MKGSATNYLHNYISIYTDFSLHGKGFISAPHYFKVIAEKSTFRKLVLLYLG